MQVLYVQWKWNAQVFNLSGKGQLEVFHSTHCQVVSNGMF